MPYHYRGRLPHWEPENEAIFLTWRLHGSYPAPRPEWLRLPAGQRFVQEDVALAAVATGPHDLKDPAVARVVAATFTHAAAGLRLYELHAWVIMSNHVHLLITPLVPLPRIMKTIKGYSARQANRVLGRTGQPFWEIESYDHWVRTPEEFNKIIDYIEYNPVKAGLVAGPADYQSSSAGLEARATGKPAERQTEYA